MKKDQQFTCPLCARKPRITIKRSKSMQANKVKQYLNLQKITHQGKKILACTKCIRTMNKVEK